MSYWVFNEQQLDEALNNFEREKTTDVFVADRMRSASKEIKRFLFSSHVENSGLIKRGKNSADL